MADERRRDLRKQADVASFLQITNPASSDRVKIGILDTSTRGMGITCEIFLPRGAEVMVTWDRDRVFGTIRYCVPNGHFFRAGLEITGKA